MVAGSEIYLHLIVDVTGLTEVEGRGTILSMLDEHGNQVTLRLRDTAVRSLQRMLGEGAVEAP